ncbi:hypothetical protein L228DRAFT_284881 [Xylona heveae TC161]|uniref:Nucleotidyltransferase n=1 Tax=Xylona heveae (strain CBS 132557 / TC161) TaxID=1328760 RepID=A0A165A9S0_XYLHT|nr:hypothetical protein L228DRAFT_284881 [Xylona heveae TC161]KZF20141.1 hypothetical protein L228DRAFT_284881 [Xylona heveae TC161]
MGGSAFSHTGPNGEQPLSTPRIPSSVYALLRDQCLRVLRVFYVRAATPVEHPGKVSYGDVDVLVEQPRRHSSTWDDLAAALNATRYLHTPGSPTISFAIPSAALNNCHFQLDVLYCKPGTFDWQLFTHSYGDLWSIIGATIRPWGLTRNDVGLYVRVKEVEAQNRKASMILLTTDPSRTLSFLGLSKEAFSSGFETLEDMFEFAAGSRFFRPQYFQYASLKANDRQRLAKRPAMQKFWLEWLPQHTADWNKDENVTREIVLDEALTIFDRWAEYELIRGYWTKKNEEETILKELTARVPLQGDKLNLLLRALRRWVVLINDTISFRDEAMLAVDGGGFIFDGPHQITSLQKKRFIQWVEANWQQVTAREQARVKQEKSKRMIASNSTPESLQGNNLLSVNSHDAQ